MEKQPQQQPPPRRRRRPALSCRECRRRKVKCDHNTPCAHCVRHKTQCIYKPFRRYGEQAEDDRPPQHLNPESEPGSSRPSSASPPSGIPGVQVLVPELQPAEHANNAHESAMGQIHGHQHAAAPSSQPLSARHPDRGEHSLQGLLSLLLQKLKENPTSGAAEGSVSPSVNRLSEAVLPRGSDPLAPRPQEASQQEWQAVLNKPRDWGRSRWVSKAPEFTVMIRCYGEILGMESKDGSFQTREAAALIAQARDFFRECKSRAKFSKVGRPTRGIACPWLDLTPPSREMADVLARLYFASFESTHRILHAPTFWAEYQRYWDDPESAAPDLRVKVLLVVGIGSSLYDHGSAAAAQSNTELLHQWIYAAQTWLSGPLEKDRLDITGLQIYCLTILARQIFSIGGDTVWVSMGSLIHRAMQMGLHRDPKSLPPMSVLQAELRRRLWATILELAVQSSLDAWMPPRIAQDEFDTNPPSNVNDDEMDESTTVLQPHPKSTFTSTSFQLALLESLPTRLRIVQLLNGMHSELSYHRVLALTSELSSALQSYSTRFSADTKDSSNNNNNNNNNNNHFGPFHRNHLDYLTRRFLIPLHYPFAHQARSNPLFRQSVKISLDAALALISPEPDPPANHFARLMSLGGGLFREGIRCATTAISLELLSHVETQRGDGSLRRAPQYRGFLKQVVRGRLVELSAERIRQGETNVKSHMFLSMILAQVEAVEEGKEVEVEVARAARDSLAFCEGWEFEGFGVDPDWEIFATNGYWC
ncbi:uncharacterized protein B0T15DRAFT_482296 [Chaetomium strumarium]|uniref:Zn(2)-C6 fungal-type domain-containing protein n=1 Tax=Chaetomium strumarium TaxID=1170767 RepID=A0AAJ0H3L5_9PEZI|nr:hypothetical protein B0T15DRAFT_482296 [Chaetomium strumarium]